MWPRRTSHNIIPVLHKPAYRPLQGTGGGVQVVQDIPGYGRWRKICANLILVSRQGFGERKTEQLGGHSQEQKRHRQDPIDDEPWHATRLRRLRLVKILREGQ